MDCIFCKIATKKIETEFLYEDEDIVVFNDLNPQAPVHFLVIPKRHIASANEIGKGDIPLIGHIFEVIAHLAKELGIGEEGYRIVNNIGEAGGQSVPHLHFHVLGGRSLQWPPG
ncbi:MAG: histidine triad nucleotide-binding protein [Tissierellia bacterium]|nr:histidine triad nucleotide-binding protein [Tissierellia bacterium]